jgi:hypothetical protein
MGCDTRRRDQRKNFANGGDDQHAETALSIPEPKPVGRI